MITCSGKNRLYFDELDFYENICKTLKTFFRTDEIFGIFKKEVRIASMDTDTISATMTPTISVDITSSPYTETSDSLELQNHSRVYIDINIYTSGKEKNLNNKKLRNLLVAYLQKNMAIGDYYSEGLLVDYNDFTLSMVDGISRGLVRFTMICDNANKYLFRE
jgi:hypothetical protein